MVVFLVNSLNIYTLFQPIVSELEQQGINYSYQIIGTKQSVKALLELPTFIDIPEEKKIDYIKFRGSAAEIADFYQSLEISKFFVPYEYGIIHDVVMELQRRNIPSIHVQHGLWDKGKLNTKYTRFSKESISRKKQVKFGIKLIKEALLKRPKKEYQFIQEVSDFASSDYLLGANQFWVPNEYYKSQVVEERPEYPQERVIAAGYMRKREPKNVSKSGLLYVFANFEALGYPSNVNSYEALTMCLDSLAKQEYPDTIKIQCHPNWPIEVDNIQKLVEQHTQWKNLSIEVFINPNPEAQLEMAEFVVGVKSAMLYEAIYYGCKVFQQNFVLERNYNQLGIDFHVFHSCSNANLFQKVFPHFMNNTTINSEIRIAFNEYFFPDVDMKSLLLNS